MYLKIFKFSENKLRNYSMFAIINILIVKAILDNE